MFWRRGREQFAEFDPALRTRARALGRAGSDYGLLRALIKGREEAMAELYRRHGGLIYRFSLRLIQDESIAEEVTQDVFLTLLEQGDKFDRDRASLATWLCGIARRLVWKQLKIRQRNLSLTGGEELDEIEFPGDDPFIAVSRGQAVSAIRRGLDELPLALREVVVLCELEEMSYQETAEILGIPVGTVRSRLHRAKHRLALLLNTVSEDSV
jgi:RNA polymerase sigma-70 factor (ECF subfamily)